MYSILPTINRDWILSKVSQEEIMVRYTGQPITINEKFKSPFRDDKSPSCVYYYSKQGKLQFRDFGKGRPMDCFEVAGQVLDCSFSEVLKQVTEDFNLLTVSRAPSVDKSLEIQKRIANEPTTINISPYKNGARWSMNEEAKAVWSKYGISEETLKHFMVFQLDLAWCNERIVYRKTSGNPGFAYWFGGGNYKLYFPLAEKIRFMQNTDVVQGLQQLPGTGDLLVITKSMKDVMVFYEHGVTAIAPQSEVHPFDDEQIKDWKTRFKRIVIVYDYDYTGVKNVNKWRKLYDLEFAFVQGAKDLSDLYLSSPYHAQQWVNTLTNV